MTTLINATTSANFQKMFSFTGTDCGAPPDTIGATYGFHVDTKYRASFFFGCEDTFTLVGKSKLNDNVIRCQEDGTWDFGDLRCEGKFHLLFMHMGAFMVNSASYMAISLVA